MKHQTIITWILQITVVVIIGQTLPFKFGAHPDSVALFTELGMESNGRILTSVLELTSCRLLLTPPSYDGSEFTATFEIAGTKLLISPRITPYSAVISLVRRHRR